jgi:hypothetical protein
MLHKNYILFALLIALASCGTNKNVQHTTKATQPAIVPHNTAPAYNVYYYASSTLTLPNDEFTIDSTAYVIYTSQQKMKTGEWKSPKGFSYLDPEDKDTLYQILSDTSLFSIRSEDVSPECPDGSEVRLKIIRSDVPRTLFINSNTCSLEFNTLSGTQKKQFKRLIAYMEKIRKNYRPSYSEKGKPSSPKKQ